jgi:hypothetical protein
MGRRGLPTLDEQVRAMVLRLAEELAQVARRAVDQAVQQELQTIVQRALRPAGARLGGRSGDGRLGKRPVPVACPVSGCTDEGIRAKRNFCAAHAAALSAAEKRRLRAAQQVADAAKPRRRRVQRGQQ